jgi:hypothetical protein
MATMRNPQSGRSLLDGWTEQLVRLTPILDHMSERGIGIDNDKRIGLDSEFKETQDEIDSKIQALTPDEIKNVEPKDGFKRKQKGLPLICLEAAGQTTLFADPPSLSAASGSGVASSAPLRAGGGNRVVSDDGTIYVTRTFKDARTKLPVQRWARLLPFAANGADQVKRYLKWKGYAIPRDFKTEKETTAEEGLRRLIKEHNDPLLPLILDYREVGKARSTYVQGWEPAADGRVHPFFLYRPATGQISSQSPNAQNFIKHSKIARAMRRMIVASPGHVLIESDYSGFHVLTLGFESADPTYIRLARIDMHSFFVLAGMLRLEPFEKLVEMDDAGLADKLKWYRKSPVTYAAYNGRTFNRIRNEIGKHAILAYGNGQMARGLFMKNREAFGTLREAEKCQSALDRLFPKPFAWKRAITLQADRQAYLISRYGYIRWFWDVFARRPVGANYQPKPGQQVIEAGNGRRWLLAPGDDHEAAISYLIQNDAFGIKRGAMVKIGDLGLDSKYGLITEIHDSLVFDCPGHLEDECVQMVKAIMEAPSPYLRDPYVAPDGLWAGVEIKRGRNWDFKDNDNPDGMETVNI